jgi:hypothetical protein
MHYIAHTKWIYIYINIYIYPNNAFSKAVFLLLTYSIPVIIWCLFCILISFPVTKKLTKS